ncbi:MAG: PEP-CTERM sorting domain-containing protein [Planctomycetes bacterium]|nr:PEP-CTERM sorting domain-containing protein [Planctomycetota bacterium]
MCSASGITRRKVGGRSRTCRIVSAALLGAMLAAGSVQAGLSGPTVNVTFNIAVDTPVIGDNIIDYTLDASSLGQGMPTAGDEVTGTASATLGLVSATGDPQITDLVFNGGSTINLSDFSFSLGALGSFAFQNLVGQPFTIGASTLSTPATLAQTGLFPASNHEIRANQGNFVPSGLISGIIGPVDLSTEPLDYVGDTTRHGTLTVALNSSSGGMSTYDVVFVIPLSNDSSPSYAEGLTAHSEGDWVGVGQFTVPNATTVPEPASMGLLAIGATALMMRRRR